MVHLRRMFRGFYLNLKLLRIELFSQIKGLSIISTLGHALSASKARQFEVERFRRSCDAYMLSVPLGIDGNLEHAESKS